MTIKDSIAYMTDLENPCDVLVSRNPKVLIRRLYHLSFQIILHAGVHPLHPRRHEFRPTKSMLLNDR